MFIKINGKSLKISEETTLGAFLADNNINSRKVVIELNRDIIRETSLDKVIIKENDTIEILSLVGGG
ncbi:MAG: sulfur carrier protein ThiS [Elusimicrobiales bacterium]|nr:sulfur carrier protein ThiS [Elusimicrobiales bacterium]MCK5582410.1 sulfur carrier protein ThiS [Elusimicrobiales bacterium]